MKKMYIVIVLLILPILFIGYFMFRYFSEKNTKSDYSVNDMEISIKNFFFRYKLEQPFVILYNKNRRDLFTEIIIIGKYPKTLKTIFSDGKTGIYAYPKEYMKESTRKIIDQKNLLNPDKNELDQLNFLMFIKDPQSNITIASVCFLESGYFILFNHYVNLR